MADKPLMHYDKTRAKREMSKPVVSHENIDTVKSIGRAAGETVRSVGRNVRQAGRDFAKTFSRRRR